jgi:hypothetical protein
VNKQTLSIASALVATVLVTLSILLSIDKLKQKGRAEVAQEPTFTSVHQRSDSEVKKFWAEELHELIFLQLVESKLPYSEINDHFSDCIKHINSRTGMQMNVSLSTSYHWSSNDVEGSASVDPNDGSVVIMLFVPAIMDLFDFLKFSNSPRWRDAFQAHCIMLFMHELEHLNKDTPMKKHIDMEEESRAWAETCRYTISPLVEKYNLPLISNDSNMYHAWKECAGDTNSEVWRLAIAKLYGDLDGRVN